MQTTNPPHEQAPPLSCDCHFHIFGPHDRFPLSPGRSYTPPGASVGQYQAMAGTLGLQRMVVVQASVYGTDNACTLDAVRQFGRDRAAAVAVIDDGFDDAALRRLDAAGVRGVRFNLVSGNGTPVEQIERLASRIAPFGWHLQLYAEGEQMAELATVLARLPVDVVLDHLGGVQAVLGTEHPQFQALLRLLEGNRTWIKLSGYRVSSGPPFRDVEANTRALLAAAPERCLWGTDWPHPNMSEWPDDGHLLDLLFAWTSAAERQRILVDNPARLYRFQ